MPRPQRDSYGSVPRLKKPASSGDPSKSSAREGRTPRRTSGPSLPPPTNLQLSAKSPSRGSQVQMSSSIANLAVSELPVPEFTCELTYGYFAHLAFQEQEDERRRLELAAAAEEEKNVLTLARESDASLSSVGSAA